MRSRVLYLLGRVVCVLFFFLICLYPVLPSWFDQQVPDTHELYRYMILADWFYHAITSGICYPRWIPDMNGGFGYPVFVFYQPAYFFINSLIAYWVEPFFLRQLYTLSLIALIGGFGVYRLARCYVKPFHAIWVVALFQIAPYVHINLYLRGDLSEWMVLELAPWPIYFLIRLCWGEWKTVCDAGFTTGWDWCYLRQ